MMASRSPFTTITTDGGLIPADLLTRLAHTPDQVSGTRPDDYHLTPGRRLRDAVNRSWTELQGVWETFSTELAKLPTGERATTITRERWLLPLFAELGFGRLQRSPGITIEGRDYPISHIWGAVPIHLLGADVDIDRRTKGVAGAATASPHSVVQECLNRSDDHLWGVVSNGCRLRVLRDNTSLTRTVYVEFDLEDMFAGQVFSDFAVLWMLCHESRFEADKPEDCWLERWVAEARQTGVRALDTLRASFETAITTLGGGFLAHPANAELRDRLRSGDLAATDFHRQVLRLVYRIVFLLVAEDRNLVHPDGTPEALRRRYAENYSLGRIRDHARHHRGGRHADLWESLKPVFGALGDDGLPALGLPYLGSFLWSPDACPDLDHAYISNADLLRAVRTLSYTQKDKTLNRVDFANLGPEELGSVYESLLELHPRIEAEAARFSVTSYAGNDRKQTGSYYTPTSLIAALLDTALDPVLDEAEKQSDPEAALLDLNVIDPACGSGHFLIAAAQRIATRLAAVRTGELAPSPAAVRHAMRDVIGRCIYGIDLNPMAVELCKVNLWLEAVDPGRPLGFLDHHIVCGNALLGTTPELLGVGIPDTAYKPLHGDDRAVVTLWKKDNVAQRQQRTQGVLALTAEEAAEKIAGALALIDAEDDHTAEGMRRKYERWNDLRRDREIRQATIIADAWCAAFVAPKEPNAPSITDALLREIATDTVLDPGSLRQVSRLAAEFRFLHWHLAFPDVFHASGSGGFHVVIGNPPWDKVQFSDEEFFASRDPAIASAAGAKRKGLIANLKDHNPELWREFQLALHHAEAESHFLRESGRFPLTARGRVNTYALFAEAMKSALMPAGRMGVIVPTGIATDDSTKVFFGACVQGRQLVCLYGFENEAFIFPGIHHATKFCLLTIAAERRGDDRLEFAFFCRSTSDLAQPERRFALTREDLTLMNPNTRTAPIFRSHRDAELTKRIYRSVPVLLRENDPAANPWAISIQQGLFNMTSDSNLFCSEADLLALGAARRGNRWTLRDATWLPLYEAKMVFLFDHRYGTYVGQTEAQANQGTLPTPSDEAHLDPGFVVQPRYWVAERNVLEQLRSRSVRWLVGFRDITSAVTERTMVAAAIPVAAVGNKLPLLYPGKTPRLNCLLPAVLSSFAHDFAARQKIGGTSMNFFIAKQLPVLPPERLEGGCRWDTGSTTDIWLLQRALELTYTSWDIAGFAADAGWSGPPFRWDPARRETLRAELDAAFFHLFGLPRDDAQYILGTFPILQRREEQRHGEYRTKRLILERFDAITKAIESGEPYETPLEPPPGDPSLTHPPLVQPTVRR